MAYKKQPLRPRICAQCGDPYQAVDRRRLYCDPSCKTLASNARRAGKESQGLAAPTTALPPLADATPEANGRASLPFDGPTIGAVAAGTMVGTYAVRAVDKLLSGPTPAPSVPVPNRPLLVEPPVPVDPASWFPAAVLAAPAASVLLPHPAGLRPLVGLQLDYFGRRFYYQPTWRVLYWESAPGCLWQLNQQAEFTRVFELASPQLAPIGAPLRLLS